jgi:hypothetical protein
VGAAPIVYESEGEHAFGHMGFDFVYTVGASGALTAVRNDGITSITRNGAGDYTMVLDALYVDIYSYRVDVEGTADAAITRTDGTLFWPLGTGKDTTTGFTYVRFGFYPNDGASTTLTDVKSGNTLRGCIDAKSRLAKGAGT